MVVEESKTYNFRQPWFGVPNTPVNMAALKTALLSALVVMLAASAMGK